MLSLISSAPPLHTDRTLVDLPDDPDYYYPTDVADHLIAWLRTQHTLTPNKPFFVYYPTPGCHSPSQVPAAWRDRYKGKFDEGWDKQREQTLARQKKLGIVPPNTQLTPKPPEMPDWDKLSEDQKKVFRRHQEIFAAYAEVNDHEVGRVVSAIEEMGVMDNTLIIYITGDNGSSMNGGPNGAFNTMANVNGIPETVEDQLKHLDEFGGPTLRHDAPSRLGHCRQYPVRLRAGHHILRRHDQRRSYSLAEADQGERRSTLSI